MQGLYSSLICLSDATIQDALLYIIQLVSSDIKSNNPLFIKNLMLAFCITL